MCIKSKNCYVFRYSCKTRQKNHFCFTDFLYSHECVVCRVGLSKMHMRKTSMLDYDKNNIHICIIIMTIYIYMQISGPNFKVSQYFLHFFGIRIDCQIQMTVARLYLFTTISFFNIHLDGTVQYRFSDL